MGQGRRGMKMGVACALLLLTATLGFALTSGIEGIGYNIQGVQLGQTPDADWWYGCSPTSAGMIIGLYDRDGYNGLNYDNLVQGGVAEISTFGDPGAILNDAIASAGHIADFWTGYGNSGDDPVGGGTPHAFDSLADFMGTSQDTVGNVDGGTLFYTYNNGDRLYAEEMVGHGIEDLDGMYGIGEYVQYAGYDTVANSLYSQRTDNQGLDFGFTYADYVSEIDAGRAVLIHVEGHSMCGYGYDSGNVLLYDTWYEGGGSMAWGGSYFGLDMWGVTAMEITGGTSGQVPDGGLTVVLMGIAMTVMGVANRRRA